jgi:hypothetical protein
MATDGVAQELFDYTEPFETLASSVQETWRSGWAPGTDHKVIHDLGEGPADVFAEVVGVDLDDFLTLGWALWNLANNGGMVGFGADLLAELGLGKDVLAAFTAQCALPLAELRERLADENMGEVATPWMRYVLQQFPFLLLADGSFLMLRLQYAVQRVFGDLLYLKVYDALKAADPQRAARFKNAMNSIFEQRVGQVLARIADHERDRFPGVIISEKDLKAAWQNRRGEHPKICDFVYAQRGIFLLLDANNRNVPKKLAERAGADLRAEIRDMFAATKFGQLISTSAEFISRGWTSGGAVVDSATKFLPFVVAPNAGMPSSEYTEMLVLEQSLPLIAGFNSRVWPPGIITMRDLQLLEGLAERAQGPRTVEVLLMWRMTNYQKITTMIGIPMPLSAFVDRYLPQLGRPMPRHDHSVGAALFETLRANAVRHCGFSRSSGAGN